MPNIISSKKDLKRSQFLAQVNMNYKIAMKSAIKAIKKSIIKKDNQDTATLLNKAFSAIDKAAKKNIIHKNNAARKKSRLNKMISKKS